VPLGIDTLIANILVESGTNLLEQAACRNDTQGAAVEHVTS